MRVIIAFCLCLLLASSSEATTYYVRTDGNNSNVGTTNTAGGAWLTLTQCVTTTLVAGDVCRVQSGTYIEKPSLTRNGSAGNTVTIIGDGTVTICGMVFTGQSYIRIINFIMNPTTGGCAGGGGVSGTGTNTGLEFWNNVIGPAGSGIIFDRGTAGTGPLCNSCIIVGGSIHDIAVATQNGGTGISLSGDHNFVGYVAIYSLCWNGFEPIGSKLKVVNIYFHDWVACGTPPQHTDFFYVPGNSPLALTASLWESITGIGTSDANNKSFHSENDQSPAWNDNVMRFNVFAESGSASAFSIYSPNVSSGQQLRWRFYNNTYVDGDRGVSGTDFTNCGNINSSGATVTYWVLNNIYQQCWADGNNSNIAPWATTDPSGADYNLIYSPLATTAFTSIWNAQTHKQNNVNPKLNNVAAQDFTLQSTSGARNVGGPLTTATSCSGSVLNVATNTGSFFVGSNSANLPQYSGAFVPGDFITINSITHQVSSVSVDAVTLTDAITCSNGDAIYFGKSSTIDLGSYPYKATGYSLSATYSINAGTATIVPNDNSLVRFVVCYDNNIPLTVVNTPPYACALGSGTFLARVYPQYASQTLSVDASLSTTNSNRFRYFRKKGD